MYLLNYQFFSRSFYFLVGLSPDGHLIIQEDREGAVFEATVKEKSFINGARHSVYYRRDHNDSELLVDRKIIEMQQIQAQTFTNVPELGANEVQIGGHNTNDPRFAIYKGYSGCLSSKYSLEVFLYKSHTNSCTESYKNKDLVQLLTMLMKIFDNL